METKGERRRAKLKIQTIEGEKKIQGGSGTKGLGKGEQRNK